MPRRTPRCRCGGEPRRARSVEPLAWNVAGLLGDEAGATRDYEVAGVTIDLGDDLRLADPIEGHVRLARTNRGLLVIADLTTSLQAECSRCLRDIEVPIEISHRGGGAAVARPPYGPAGRAAKPDEDELLRLTDHHELDLEAARPRGDPAGRADRPALPRRTAPASASSAASGWTRASTTTRPTTSTRGSRRSRRSGRRAEHRRRRLPQWHATAARYTPRSAPQTAWGVSARPTRRPADH